MDNRRDDFAKAALTGEGAGHYRRIPAGGRQIYDKNECVHCLIQRFAGSPFAREHHAAGCELAALDATAPKGEEGLLGELAVVLGWGEEPYFGPDDALIRVKRLVSNEDAYRALLSTLAPLLNLDAPTPESVVERVLERERQWREYVALLHEELAEIIPQMINHGWSSSRVAEGIRRRKALGIERDGDEAVITGVRS